MKKNNKKTLYEKIMQNVAKNVKKALNENDNNIETMLNDVFSNNLDYMIQDVQIGCNSSDFSNAAEALAHGICQNADEICNAPDNVIGRVIKDIINYNIDFIHDEYEVDEY